MTNERMEAIEARLAELSRGGASVTVQDPRVNQVQTWIIGLVGMGIIAALGYLANSVDNLNRSFAGITEWRVSVDRRLDNLERPNARP